MSIRNQHGACALCRDLLNKAVRFSVPMRLSDGLIQQCMISFKPTTWEKLGRYAQEHVSLIGRSGASCYECRSPSYRDEKYEFVCSKCGLVQEKLKDLDSWKNYEIDRVESELENGDAYDVVFEGLRELEKKCQYERVDCRIDKGKKKVVWHFTHNDFIKTKFRRCRGQFMYGFTHAHCQHKAENPNEQCKGLGLLIRLTKEVPKGWTHAIQVLYLNKIYKNADAAEINQFHRYVVIKEACGNGFVARLVSLLLLSSNEFLSINKFFNILFYHRLGVAIYIIIGIPLYYMHREYVTRVYGYGMELIRSRSKTDLNDIAAAWNKEGKALYSRKKYKESLNAYNQAIELIPQCAEAWNNKGIALKALGRTGESNAAFARAKELGYTG